jgi:ssDNA thymidine ADP-ribosyltransferase DarT-like protein
MANMANPDPLSRISFLYHFTDRRNLPLIREHGGIYTVEELLKAGIKVPAPGGNDWSRSADNIKGMDKYIHLCFRNNHPMEYVARQAGHIADTIYLQIHANVLQWEGVRYTADVANKAGVEIHTIEEARKMIDFEVLYTRTDWNDSDIKSRLQQAEKCEILVPRKIPLDMIRNLPNG